jgi:hypothetical protein
MVVTARRTDVERGGGRRPVRLYSEESLQGRIPASGKRRFKAHAAMRGTAPNKYSVEAWEQYERTRPVHGWSEGDLN